MSSSVCVARRREPSDPQTQRSALAGPDGCGGRGDRGVTHGTDLLGPQGPVGRSHDETVGERLLARPDLLTDVDVEEVDRLEQLARTLAERQLDRPGWNIGI